METTLFNFSLSTTKQPVRKVIEDIDALLEELLVDDYQQLKVNSLKTAIVFI